MKQYPITAEINLNALKHNILELKKLLPAECKFIAVIKANAYGHGIVKIGQSVLKYGADCLAVARAYEAILLRKNNIVKPILVFGYVTDDEIDELIINNVTFTIFALAMAEKLDIRAKKLNKTVSIHIKIDTGMSRLGFPAKPETLNIIKKIKNLPNLILEGVYTHFADADNNKKQYTHHQLSLFKNFLSLLDTHHISIPIKHAANSAAVIDHPEAHFNAVRPGIALYGLYPSEHVDKNKIKLNPVMKLKVKIAQVKKIEKNTKVGYGCKFTAKKDLKIATLPIGYADGFTRMLKNGKVLINGCEAQVIGVICMDQCMINVDNIPNVKAGDEAVIIGSQGDKAIHAEDIAKELKTINYEIITMISSTIPRVYIK
jgi:alanine racemase